MAGLPIYRFKLYHDPSYPLGEQIPTPIGWDEAKLKLERHPDYHTLIEYFEGEFIFWGHGRDIIKAIEVGYGIDALIRITIEIKYSSEWNLLFDGQLDLSQIEDIQKGKTFYKCKLPIIRNDFWAKFINRKSIEVDVLSPKNLDGGDVSVGTVLNAILPPQVLNQVFDGNQDNDYLTSDGTSLVVGKYIQCAFDSVINLDELKNRYSIPFSFSDSLPAYIFTAELAGDYTFDICIPYALISSKLGVTDTYSLDSTFTYLKSYVKKNNDTPIIFNSFSSIEYDLDLIPTFVTHVKINFAKYNGTISLDAGDQIRIYTKVANINWGFGGWTNRFTIGGIYGSERMRMKITGATIYPLSNAQGILIKDVCEYVLDRIIGQENIIESDFFNTPDKDHLILKGKHVRGYQFAEKGLSLSLDQWWSGANPLFNLSLGYTDDGKIKIEKKEYAYNPEMSITLDGVGNMVRTYQQDKFFKEILSGFEKWSAESTSGIDDIQTKSKYSMRFSKNGKSLNIKSTFYAAGLGIEQTRRNKREAGKDWKLDEDIMIISGGSYGMSFYIEQGNYQTANGIINADSRYNLRHSPAAIIKRWIKFIQSCVQQYDGDKIRFTSGEGNYSSSITRAITDNEFPGETITDGADITVDILSDVPLFFPAAYKFKYPLTFEQYNLIRTNRNNAIGISKTNAGHKPFFIIDSQWSPQHGNAEFIVMPKYLSDTFTL